MTGTITTIDASDRLVVLGETLRPLLTNAMGSSLEIFDTSGPADAGPPPHIHPWEEVYVVLDGELEVFVDGERTGLSPGGVAHVPAGVSHAYRNVTDAHFLTIVTKGNAAQFFEQVRERGGDEPTGHPGHRAGGRRPRHSCSSSDGAPSLHQPETGSKGGGDAGSDPASVRRAALRSRPGHLVAERSGRPSGRVGAHRPPVLPQRRRPDHRRRRVVRPAVLPDRSPGRAGPDDLARYFHDIHTNAIHLPVARALATARSPVWREVRQRRRAERLDAIRRSVAEIGAPRRTTEDATALLLTPVGRRRHVDDARSRAAARADPRRHRPHRAIARRRPPSRRRSHRKKPASA